MIPGDMSHDEVTVRVVLLRSMLERLEARSEVRVLPGPFDENQADTLVEHRDQLVGSEATSKVHKKRDASDNPCHPSSNPS